MKENETTLGKLEARCQVLEKMVDAMVPIYFDNNTTDDQRKLIETTIGAAIFYLPQGDNYWTGKISVKALEALNSNKKVVLTKEHQFPRKIAAREILHKIRDKDLPQSLKESYEMHYGQFNYVTSTENKAVSKFQRSEVYVDMDTAYRLAGIEMVSITKKELNELKKRNRLGI